MSRYQGDPADLLDWGEPPEIWVDCPECCGEGSIEVYDPVGKWSDDPYGGRVLTCTECGGAGGFIEEAPGVIVGA